MIARIAPEAPVIDLTHGIPRHDVRQGAAVLANALPYTPPGVHLAVVDPGVGTERRAVAVRVADDDRVLVGPDNGLLWPAAERFAGVAEAVDVSRSEFRLEPLSATFHGRDVFAPVAAALAQGAELAEVGEPVDADALIRLDRRQPRIDPGRGAVAGVAYLDRFGNAALELTAGETDAGRVQARPAASGRGGRSRRRGSFTRSRSPTWTAGELLLYLDSYGRLALAVNRGSAADRLDLVAGDEVSLRLA